IEPRFLRSMTRRVCDQSFNRISVDGDTSTNDTVFIMANAMAGNPPVNEKSPDAEKLLRALTDVAQQLAVEIASDGEGARRLLEIRVEGAASQKVADAIARAIGLSPLVKTALAGADPNWGRILSAAGNAGVEFHPAEVDIYME